MNFPEEHPMLTTSRLILKKVMQDDLSELEEIVSYRPVKDLTAAQLLKIVNQQFIDKTAINWGVYFNNELIGTVGFYRGFNNNIGEVGYVTRESFRGKGFTTSAVNAVVEYGLHQMRLTKVIAYTSHSNRASQAILRKLNFKQVKAEKPEDLKFERIS